MIEKRKYKRFPVVCKVEYTGAEIIVLEMSAVGMKLKSSHSFDKNTDLDLTVVLPDFEIIKFKCHIQRIWKDKNGDFLYGCKILHISDEKTYLEFIDNLYE